MQENIIKISEMLGGRYSPYFYQKEFISLDKLLSKKIETRKLKDICSLITDGTHFTPQYLNEGVKFLSVKDVRENIVYFDRDVKYISKEEHNKLIKRARPLANDILLTKVGATYGIASVIPKDAEEFSIFVSLALLKIKKELAESQFVSIFLNSNIAKKQMDRVVKGVGQPDLHLEDIREIKIPLLKIEQQKEIISIMDKAYSQKREKEEQARKLLTSIDEYILNELGITLPEYKKEKDFKVKISSLLSGRYDPEYNQPYFQVLKDSIRNIDTVEHYKISDLISNKTINTSNLEYINYVDLGCVEESTNTIEYKELEQKEIPSRAKMMIEKGDFIFSGLAGSISSIAMVDKQLDNMVASTGFFVIKPSKEVLNNYLFSLFKTSFMQKLLVRHASGAVMPAINASELENIKIPIPPLVIQEEIASKVQELIQQAKQLQTQAKSVLEEAKAEVEKILLGE